MQLHSFFLLFLFCWCTIVLAQETPINDQSDQILEILSEQTESTFDFDTYQEILNDLKENPIDLNNADFEALAKTGLFTSAQIIDILNYRKRMNGFTTIYELQALESLDLPTIRKLLPYITIGPLDQKYKVPLKRMAFGGKYQLFLRYTQTLETQKGYTITDTNRSRYLGSPQRYYVRFRYNYSTKVSYGFTAEKDPGEEFFKGTQKQGFDFYSGHLYVRDVWKFKAIALGDYQVKWGQGLTLWTGFGFRKSPAVTSIQKNPTGFTPYTSVNEFNFLRGAAATIQSGRWSVSSFFSHKNQSASVVTTIDSTGAVRMEASSLYEAGLHRTPTETAKKNSLRFTMLGGNVKYRFNKAVVGINAIHTRFNIPVVPSTELYRKYNFTGSYITNMSVDYAYLVRQFNFFGETALTDKGGLATINGLTINEGSSLEMAFLYRHFNLKYYSVFNNAFAESTTPSNESGFYTGMVIRPIKRWRIDTYIDLYRFPWLRYLTDAPSHGFDYFLQLNYKPARNVQMYARYRYENKQSNVTGNTTKIDYLTEVKRQNMRFHIDYLINSKIELSNRFEVTWFDNNVAAAEKGFMAYQDVKLTPFRFPLTLYARYVLFDTPSYNTRIYAYENDILYSFSIPPLYDNGFRYYFLLKYDITQNLSVWLRFAQTQFSNRKTVGSGLDEIQGNSRSEIKAQIRLRF
jgi:hypothetical protein